MGFQELGINTIPIDTYFLKNIVMLTFFQKGILKIVFRADLPVKILKVLLLYSILVTFPTILIILIQSS